MSNLVLSIAIGENYKGIADITFPFIEDYAKKVGADCELSISQRVSSSYPYWEKFIIKDLLDKYERILYFDIDVLIRKDCPNLFNIIPENKLGMYNEGLLTTALERGEHTEVMNNVFKEYGEEFPRLWDGRFYNSGVMMVPKSQRDLFIKPVHEMFAHYWDQAYLNMIILLKEIDVFDITYKFNRMYYVDPKVNEHRLHSYIIHYAGIQSLVPVLKGDIELLKIWEKNPKIFEVGK